VDRHGRGRIATTRSLAFDAVIYGLPSVMQYAQMHAQAVNDRDPRHVGFNRFSHDSELAGPGYEAFKTPNADTLYSNAWLDLTQGPVVVDVPAFGTRYYTLHFLDMYSNSTNLSLRTVGGHARRFLVAPCGWQGSVPPATTLFRVATPYMWILMRIFSTGGTDLDAALSLQRSVQLRPVSDNAAAPDLTRFPRPVGDGIFDDPDGFLPVLDHVLRTNGHPDQETALVYRLRALGMGGPRPFDIDDVDGPGLEGVHLGFDDAMTAVTSAATQLGTPIGETYWRRGNPGVYGFNYLRRAATNYLGLGANIVEECQAFNCFRDAGGVQLDAGETTYTVRLPSPPPADAFWSLTLYDATTRELYPNEISRYAIGDRTGGLLYEPDGSLVINLQHVTPEHPANWLPAPAGPFYLIIRAYSPKPELVQGSWEPGAVERVDAER
jgi:hypothetical protein